jgi:hypothetical protein
VTIQLPAGSRVEAKAASAEFRTVGRLGDVAFDSSQASIKLDEAASARLTTVDGDVSVGRLGGDAQIRTARGDIQIAEARRGTGTADLGPRIGATERKVPPVAGHYEFKLVSGRPARRRRKTGASIRVRGASPQASNVRASASSSMSAADTFSSR